MLFELTTILCLIISQKTMQKDSDYQRLCRYHGYSVTDIQILKSTNFPRSKLSWCDPFCYSAFITHLSFDEYRVTERVTRPPTKLLLSPILTVPM